MKLENPIYSLLEDYFKSAFDLFNSTLEKQEQVKIYVGRVGVGFLREAEDTAVFNIYAVNTQTKVGLEYYDYSQDIITFHIDVFASARVKPVQVNKYFIYQDEVAHKTLLLYTNFARSVLQNLYTQNYGGLSTILGDFHFLGMDNFIPTYSESEIVSFASRIKFTVDAPFYPSDSNNYNELKSIFVSLNGNLGLDISY